MKVKIVKKRFMLGFLAAILSVVCILCSSSSGEATAVHEDPENGYTIYKVQAAEIIFNLFVGINIPQNPGMAENNWSGGHNDSYCSESVGLSGPTTEYLKVTKKENPYGFSPIMACNSNNQMVASAYSLEDLKMRLIVFDEDLNILTASEFADKSGTSFAGGYFFMDNEENSITVGYNKISAFPTSNVEQRDETYELEPLWVSDDIVELVTGSSENNSLYACLPIWDEARPHTYWTLLAGEIKRNGAAVEMVGNAYMALVEIVPDENQPNGCTTTLIDAMELDRQWNNNTLAVDEDGVYFVTNGVNAEGVCDFGFLHALSFDEDTQSIVIRWQYAYENSGMYNFGSANIGSGTTPTIMDDGDGNKFVTIGDNALPRMNMDVVNHADGTLFTRQPVFASMRSMDEASFIGVNNFIVAENNFGHLYDPPNSQLVPNQPGFVMIRLQPDNLVVRHEIVWEYNLDSMFAMSMLARESGVIFAHTGSWDDSISATNGGVYYITAFSSLSGRIFWKIPLGRGFDYCHEYGGIYFDRKQNMYIGTNNYLFSVQEYVSATCR